MEGYFLSTFEYFAFANQRRPDKYQVDVMGEYLGITRVFEISVVESFPDYVLPRSYDAPFEMCLYAGPNITDTNVASYGTTKVNWVW